MDRRRLCLHVKKIKTTHQHFVVSVYRVFPSLVSLLPIFTITDNDKY